MIVRFVPLFAIACASSPSVDVVATTDLPCGAVAPAIVTWAPQGQTATPSGTFVLGACTGIGDLGAVIITPVTTAQTIEIVAAVSTAGGNGSGTCLTAPDASCIVARQLVQLPTSDRVEVSIALDASCTGISCGAGMTCTAGQCVSE
jgi:hypothetical protein